MFPQNMEENPFVCNKFFFQILVCNFLHVALFLGFLNKEMYIRKKITLQHTHGCTEKL